MFVGENRIRMTFLGKTRVICSDLSRESDFYPLHPLLDISSWVSGLFDFQFLSHGLIFHGDSFCCFQVMGRRRRMTRKDRPEDGLTLLITSNTHFRGNKLSQWVVQGMTWDADTETDSSGEVQRPHQLDDEEDPL